MSGIQRVLVGVLAVLAAVASYAGDLPILPAPNEIATLPKPAGFKSSLHQPLDRGVGSLQARSAPTVESRTGSKPLAIVSIDPELLRSPAATNLNNQVLGLGQRRPAASPLTIRIASRELHLAWVAEASEPSSSVRHVTMQVLNVPDGYARFSVKGEEVVGTIVTPPAIYRIVPNGPGTQAIFAAFAPESSYSHFKYARQLHAPAEGSALERRHVQLERLAEIQPEFVSASDAGRYLNIRGGKLGRIIGKADSSKVRAVIESLGELTNVPLDLQVQIEKINSHQQGTQIAFHQLVRGIPYFAINEIGTDRAGNVVSVQTQFVDSSTAHEVTLSQAEAQRHALEAIEARIKAPIKEIELLRPTQLYYYRDASTQRLAPYYTFYVRVQGSDGTWAVRVDAANGSARILERPQEFGWRVCNDSSSTADPTTCSDAGTNLIYYHTYNGTFPAQCPYRDPRNPNTVCHHPDPAEASQAMGEANYVLHQVQQANPTVCCDRIGGADHTVDLVYKTSATSVVAEYDPASESIRSAPSSDYLRNKDVVWHEFGHHFLYKNATGFDFASRYGQSGEYFTTVVVEAIGDLMTAGITLNARPSTIKYGDIGTAWVNGDGAYAPPGGTPRDLADPNITSFYHISTASSPHDAGRAISKYLYNIYTTSGISAARFMEILTQVTRNIRDVDGNHLDLPDIKAALLASTRSDESALVQAINARFDEMYNNIPGANGPNPPVGVPTSSTAPGAPYPVTATFTGNCPIVSNVRTSEWLIEWARPPFAVSYVVTVQQINGPLRDSVTVSDTRAFAHTNVPAHGWVVACNASGSCSGSSNIVTISHRAECDF